MISCADQGDCPRDFRCVTSVGRCLPVGNADITPPGLAGPAVLSPSIVRAGQVVTVSFRANEPLFQSPTVVVQFANGALSLPLDASPVEGSADEYRLGWPVIGNEPEGAARVLVSLLDLSGNEAPRVDLGAVILDFTPPSIVRGSETLSLMPGPSSPLPAVAALGPAGSATLGFTVSEPLRDAPRLSAGGDAGTGDLTFVLSLRAAVTWAWTVSTPGTAMIEGPVSIVAELEDLAGNVTRQPVGLAAPGLLVDTVAPLAPSTSDGGLTVVRAPWGSAALGEVASSSLQAGEGTFEPGALVLVTERDLLREVARAPATDAGGLAVRVPVDARELFVTAVDQAGNRSPPVRVTSGTLVLALGTTAVVNPSRAEARQILGPALVQPDAVVMDANAGLTAVGGGVVTTSGTVSWRLRSREAPPGALHLPFVWDEAAARGVALGGERGGLPVTGRTWLWTGTTWLPAAVSDPEGDGQPVPGPGTGVARAAAHDPVSRQTLLVVDAPGGLETWAWNGQSWARLARSASGPGCDGCRLVWSEALGRVVLVEHPPGGNVRLSAWHAAAARWEALDGGSTGPGARRGAAVASDGRTGGFVLLGGTSDAGALSEFWSWRPSGWSRIEVDGGPGAAFARAAAWDPVASRVVFAGGFAGDGDGGWRALDEAWEWDGQAFARVSGPDGGTGLTLGAASLLFDRVRGQRILVGGAASPSALPQDATWGWVQGRGWVRLFAPGGPLPRAAHAATWDPVRARTLIFGGRTDDGFVNAYRDLWAWDGVAWAWVEAPTSPGPDARFRAVLTPRGGTGELVLTGGVGLDLDCLGDAWLLRDDRWVPLPVASPRCGHVALWEPSADTVLVAGGASSVVAAPLGAENPGPLNVSPEALWFDGGWHLGLDAGVFPLYGAAFAAGPTPGTLLAHGGVGSGGLARDTWEWDAGAWRKVSSAGPSVAHGALAFDGTGGRWLHFGGSTPIDVNELWGFSGGAWSRFAPADPEGDGSPSPRSRASLTFDSDRDVAVLFGGLGAGQAKDDTWELTMRGRPGQVLRAPLASLGAPLPSLGAVELRGVAGGSSDRGPGVEVWWWVEGAWLPAPTFETTGLPHEAPAGSPRPFVSRITQPELLEALLRRPELAIAITTRGGNGRAAATLVVDQLEATVEYQLR
jgi:hypothetical protein